MEVINLDSVDLNEGETIKLSSSDNASSTSMAGAELLMNMSSKKKTVENKDINLDDLQELEKDLNELTENNVVNEPSIKLNVEEDTFKESHLPSKPIETTRPEVNISDNEKSWDGYQKINNIPINLDKPIPNENKRSREETLRMKFDYLRKLEALQRKGVRLSKEYNMDSSLDEMIGEYETIKSEKERKNSVKFQGRMLMAAVTGLEFLNNRFDPFDFKLDGWSEQVNENIDDYDEIFGELHEKYSSKAKMAPELKLLFQLGGSAIMLHMTNTMFKSAMPGMDDILRQNPELMQQFTQATVNQMSDKQPGFGNFMSGMMNQNQSRRQPSPPPPQMNMGPPPEAVKTKNPGRMDNYSRPDIGFGRGAPEEGVNLSQNFESMDKPQRSARKSRPEMKGPSSDIDELLSGLKNKSVPVVKKSSPKSSPKNSNKKSKGRSISEKNTVSLDL